MEKKIFSFICSCSCIAVGEFILGTKQFSKFFVEHEALSRLTCVPEVLLFLGFFLLRYFGQSGKYRGTAPFRNRGRVFG